jgi:prepilin-type N-terminal cleavage/methylation domain-containing protein
MKQRLRHNGFSLTEVLLATGVLAIGLVMIAMVFPVGVKLTSTATERTVAATAANEAFAKYSFSVKAPDGPPPACRNHQTGVRARDDKRQPEFYVSVAAARR